MAPRGKLVIAYISYLLIGVLFPVMDISLNSLLPVMTSDMTERNSLSTVKGFAYIVGMLAINIFAPIVIGNTSQPDGYIKMIMISLVVVVALSLLGSLGVKERVQQSGEKKHYGVKQLFLILGQRPVWSAYISTFAFMVSMYLISSTNTFFYTYVIDDLGLMSIAALVQSIVAIPVTLIVTPLIRKFGKKKLIVAGIFLFGVFPLLRLLNVTSIPLLLVANGMTGIGMGLCLVINYGMVADNTDYVELATGFRAEAAIASLSSFITKCAMGIGGSIPGYMLALSGFQKEAAIQPDGVRKTIIFCVLLLPAIISMMGCVIFGVTYPFTKEKLEVQNRKLAEIRKDI